MVLNVTRNTLVARELKVARNFFERVRGLIGSKPLCGGEGFLIPYCRGIHTFGMSYAIDVLYLDDEGKIVAAFEGLDPNRFGAVNLKTRSVLELPVGAIKRSKSQVGDLLNLTRHLISVEARRRVFGNKFVGSCQSV